MNNAPTTDTPKDPTRHFATTASEYPPFCEALSAYSEAVTFSASTDERADLAGYNAALELMSAAWDTVCAAADTLAAVRVCAALHDSAEAHEEEEQEAPEQSAPFAAMTDAQVHACFDALLAAREDNAAAAKDGDGSERSGEQGDILHGLCRAALSEMEARKGAEARQ